MANGWACHAWMEDPVEGVMEYTGIRHLHIACATLSITLFVLRWGMDLLGTAWRQWSWLRIAPHVNDTVLLTAAIALATMSHQYPWELPWLGAKVVLLLAYIGFGKIALRPGLNTPSRLLWGVCALFTVLSIVAIATMRPAFLSH